ncbi:MAG TPA: pitrilysin family protein [Blastocatellia bacterium]|nr:pitrilysin family protein [Blastocatellia bacterium]
MELNIERIELPNGLVVLLSENHALPAVSINAVVKTGERYVTDDKAGLGSLAGELLDEGTATRTAQQIAGEIESVGGALQTAAGYATTGVSVTALASDLSLGLELTADLLRHPTFPEDRIALEVSRKLAEIRAKQDEPRVVASEAFNEIIFAGTPQHRPLIGYEETVAKITRASLLDYYRRFFVPNNTIIAIAGDFSSAVAEKVRQLFGDWPRDPQFEPPAVPRPQRQREPVARFISKDKEQVNIYLGHTGIERANPDYYAIRVMDVILGDSPGFTSRIPRILRDEQGLAYTTYCHLARSAGLDPGRFVAFIGTAPENLERAVSGLREQIASMTAAPPTAEEVEAAKAYLTGSFVFEFETNAQMAAFMVSAEIHQLGFDYPGRFLSEISRVTAEDVWRAAQQYTDPDNLTLVVVGPTDQRGEVGSQKSEG